VAQPGVNGGRLPAVFVSHGAPTLAIENGPTAAFLRTLGRDLVRPRAILCVSAHWDTPEPRVTLSGAPATIHDFSGFPEELERIRYPAPGDPVLAERVVVMLRGAGVAAAGDDRRGLDHGAWVPLSLMYPDATLPVVQLSVQSTADARHHHVIGAALAPLRDDGVLILASGGATHDLRGFWRHAVDAAPVARARAFDEWLATAIETGRTEELLDWERRAPEARHNHPTTEHFLPLFVTLGAAGAAGATAGGHGRRLHAGFTYGALSMASFAWVD